MPGFLTTADLANYEIKRQAPTHVSYRGRDIYGMAPSSSGGTTVGEALNILSNWPLSSESRAQALFHYLEASRLAFADRNAWVGDPEYVSVPEEGLLDPDYAATRACLVKSTALTSPVAPGSPYEPYQGCGSTGKAASQQDEGTNTNHLVAVDKWGNVVSYTNTIEQLAGSGITVPGRGFLLNNEMTDFDFAPATPTTYDPNLPGQGKRPRSSMSPTIALRDGKFDFAVGSPGGATIITTVLQTLVNYIDLKQSLPAAVAAPRASQRNTEPTPAEPAFIAQEGPALTALGHAFSRVTPDPPAEIGSVEAIRFLKNGRQQAVAEPSRRGGCHAMVVRR
jgi:gamma-glutamyltranspeptidase / glutathione hydrolase